MSKRDTTVVHDADRTALAALAAQAGAVGLDRQVTVLFDGGWNVHLNHVADAVIAGGKQPKAVGDF